MTLIDRIDVSDSTRAGNPSSTDDSDEITLVWSGVSKHQAAGSTQRLTNPSWDDEVTDVDVVPFARASEVRQRERCV